MKKKKRNPLFIFGVFIFVWLLSLQLLGNQTPGANTEPKAKSLSGYPATPEGVVEAFVQVDFDGIGNEVIGDIKKRLQYTTWDSWAGSDTFPISLKYKIIKLQENSEKAKIKVVHEYLGDVGIEFLEVERKPEEIMYYLKKEKDIWKITFPEHAPYISVKTAIRLLEWGIESYKKDAGRVDKIKKHIITLKKYL